MKIGIGLPNQIPHVNPSVIPGWSSRAEEAGFSALSTVGRFAFPGVMDTVALAGAAAATSRIALTTSVMLHTVWPSVLLAKELASIDGMSGGRLTLGIGIGGDRHDDFVVDGLPPRGLGRRMDEALETYRSVWRGDTVGGGINAAVPAGTRSIPMVFGGMSPASFKRMAKWGEGYIAGSLPPSMIEPIYESARQAWNEEGRDGSPKLMAVAYFGFGDAESARKNIRAYYEASPDFVDMVVNGISLGRDAIRETVRAFSDIGTDELLFLPAIPDPDEVDKLAETVL